MQAFYVRVRRCLLHPSFAKIKDYPEVTTMEQYNAAPSCKLQSLVEILKHHLAVDGAPGIKPSRHQPPEAFESPSTSPLTPPLPLPPILPPDVPLQSQQHQENATSPPDKIVIYCYFATSFNFVEMVSCGMGMRSHVQADSSAGVEAQWDSCTHDRRKGQPTTTC